MLQNKLPLIGRSPLLRTPFQLAFPGMQFLLNLFNAGAKKLHHLLLLQLHGQARENFSGTNALAYFLSGIGEN
jgi:hypothetical protein